ncbi:MAG: hypothetical protein GY841_19405, partial [FCB group bacterium]|nr:hypothetical protein [FCB group bacterium]
SQGDQEPNEMAYMLGLFKTGRIGTVLPDLKIEYVRIANRTYHQADPRNRYIYRNKLLGHPLGPDADSLSFKARFWPSDGFFAEIEFAYRRKGRGSIDAPWDEPWLDVVGDYEEPFPTGVVEKATLVAFRAQGYLPFTRYTRRHFFAAVELGWGHIRNNGNVEAQTTHPARVELSLTWFGFTDIDISD